MELGFLFKLEGLSIRFNNLTGTIPPSLGNSSSLVPLNVTYNDLTGSILTMLRQLPKLEYFAVPINRLSGTIPPTNFNLSSIKTFTLMQNQIGGSLPLNLGIIFPNLEFFSISGNQFTGSIPVSTSNMSSLAYLQAMGNNLTGKVPNLGKLYKLSSFIISTNYLGSSEANDLSFISSLINATDLEILALDNNNFRGLLPESFANLSINLVGLWLGNNQMHGNILHRIANFINLTRNLRQMNKLYLSNNNFQGNIPSSLGACTHLLGLDLSQNNFNGTIPPQIFGISTLSYLYLYQNQIIGSLSMEVGHLKNLAGLEVSNNFLSGEIPSTLDNCVVLGDLYMDGNSFQGTIPSSLSTLRGLQGLDLSYNNLSSQIPEYLGTFDLQYLNISFDNLEGPVLKDGIFKNASKFSINGNPKLYGALPQLQLPAFYGRLGLSLVVGFLSFCWFRKAKQEPTTESTGNSLLKVSYQNLLRATNDFSSSNLIGVGSYGSVYRGILDGTIFAVKLLNLLNHGASKSFIAKVMTSRLWFNGNLDEWLHPNPTINLAQVEPKTLNLLQRLNIAIDVACALDYLHNHCETPIAHCDIKPSNVHVGDFGIARFHPIVNQNFSSNPSDSSGFDKNYNTCLAKYGMRSEVSTYGNVYSFGIFPLEMFTGKRPTNDMFRDGFELHNFVEAMLLDRVVEIVYPILLQEKEEGETSLKNTKENNFMRNQTIQDCLISILRVGVACSAKLTREMMNIIDVVAKSCNPSRKFFQLE
ncbi:hypothetical protein ACSBR2_004897 [Camellia fascicularis]